MKKTLILFCSFFLLVSPLAFATTPIGSAVVDKSDGTTIELRCIDGDDNSCYKMQYFLKQDMILKPIGRELTPEDFFADKTDIDKIAESVGREKLKLKKFKLKTLLPISDLAYRDGKKSEHQIGMLFLGVAETALIVGAFFVPGGVGTLVVIQIFGGVFTTPMALDFIILPPRLLAVGSANLLNSIIEGVHNGKINRENRRAARNANKYLFKGVSKNYGQIKVKHKVFKDLVELIGKF